MNIIYRMVLISGLIKTANTVLKYFRVIYNVEVVLIDNTPCSVHSILLQR